VTTRVGNFVGVETTDDSGSVIVKLESPPQPPSSGVVAIASRQVMKDAVRRID
jgi:hypothetical protein